MGKTILSNEAMEDLKEAFKLLDKDVTVALFTEKGKNDQYGEIALQLLQEVASASPYVKLQHLPLTHDFAKRHGIDRSPTVMVAPEDYHIRFTGTPMGEEGRTLVMAIIMAGTSRTALSELSLQRLTQLKEKRHIQIYVSPT